MKEKNRQLSPEDAARIRNWGERVFALACLSKDRLTVFYQIGVNGSIIDFRVVNNGYHDDVEHSGNGHGQNGNGHSRLVEVTSTPRQKALCQRRKRRQIKSMANSGEDYAVMYGEELTRISQANDF